MKFNRKGKFVCVQTSLTWVTDQFLYYTSEKHKDWIIIEWDHFFRLNKDLLKTYCSGIKDIKSTNIVEINTLVNTNN
jgi:hypothetical protein